MQTTLLSLAVAIILALVGALIAPFVIDWNNYRPLVEREASRITGLDLRVTGPIDVRLLPTPQIKLAGIEAKNAPLRVQSLAAELSLGNLMRGEWRATELQLLGPQIDLALDADGQLRWPALALGLDPDALSIERVSIQDARLSIADAASGARTSLEQLWFNGDLRSLAGPLRGEGAFTLDGEAYPFRISAGRVDDEGRVKVRLNVDPVNRPLNMEADGTLALAKGTPSFEGSVSATKPVGLSSLRLSAARVTSPWRASAKVKASAASALLEQLEFLYGSEEQGARLTGTAEVTFGRAPRLNGVLAARQIDLDRALASDGKRQTPVEGLRMIAEAAGGSLPLPAQLGISADTMTFGGAALQAVRGDIASDGSGWTLQTLEFRAPGLSRVQVAGRLTKAANGQSAAFTGDADVDSANLGSFVAWLDGRSDAPAGVIRPLKARGQITIGGERVAVERLRAEFGRESVEGRAAYVFATAQTPPRFDAALRATELDLDGARAFAQGALADSAFEKPQDVTLSLDIGRASMAGVAAREFKANIRSSAAGVRIEQLSVADLGGAALSLTGQVSLSPQPRGNGVLDIDARDIAGVGAVAAQYLPALADPLKRLTGPAKLRATLAMDGTAKLSVEGRVAAMRINATAQADGDVSAFDTTPVTIDAQIDADDIASVVALAGADRFVAVDKQPGRMTLAANGPLRGETRVDARINSGSLQGTAIGTVTLADAGVSAALQVDVAKADLRSWRRAEERNAPLPVTITTRATVKDKVSTFADLSGLIAGAPFRGRLSYAYGEHRRIDGDLALESVDVPALVALAAGVPAVKGNSATVPWPAEPFVSSPFEGNEGKLVLSAQRASFGRETDMRDAKVTIVARDGDLSFDDATASFAGGRVSGRLALRRSGNGTNGQIRVALDGVDAAALFPGAVRAPLSGKLSLVFDAEGGGLSPNALVASLKGQGSFALNNAILASLDARMFETVTRAVDRGLPVDGIRIGDVVGKALDGGSLRIAKLEGPLAISAGQVRLAPVKGSGEGAALTVGGQFDLTTNAIDARLTLTGPAPVVESATRRPDIFIALRGPYTAPNRSLDVSSFIGWLTLRAVEIQTRKLEAAERERAADAAAPPPPPQPAPPPPPPTAERAPALPTPTEIRPRPAPRPAVGPLQLVPQHN